MPRGVFVAVVAGRKPPLRFQGWAYRFIHRTPLSFYGFHEQEMIGLNGAAHVGVFVATMPAFDHALSTVEVALHPIIQAIR
ncbi:MAG TPA: hypothetical protein VNL71_19420 [Chloroflexota bacterium]|nr:hypothetical protein [Chloroflexota bacterium]